MTLYRLTCKCGAQCSVPGEEDDDTNGAEYDTSRAKWEGGDPACEHEEYVCTGVDHDDFGIEDWHGGGK